MACSSPRVQKKRAVNLFVNSELLDEAKRLGINVSETLERRLRNIVRAEQEKRSWLGRGIARRWSSINAFIDSHGLLSSRLRYRADNG